MPIKGQRPGSAKSRKSRPGKNLRESKVRKMIGTAITTGRVNSGDARRLAGAPAAAVMGALRAIRNLLRALFGARYMPKLFILMALLPFVIADDCTLRVQTDAQGNHAFIGNQWHLVNRTFEA